MNEARFQQIRSERRSGDVREDLLAELKQIALHMALHRGLPRVYSPYGHWNYEAAEEIFSAWATERLIGKGHLLLLLDKSPTLRVFRTLCEQNLRQYLINALERSQTSNLYQRLGQLLDPKDGKFVPAQVSGRSQDTLWDLRGREGAVPFLEGEDQLAAAAWSLGEFQLVRFKPDAKKLAPLLSTPDLERFVEGMLERCGQLTRGQLVRALELRFNLGSTSLAVLDEDHPERHRATQPEQSVVLRETALAIIAELTARQAEVLRRLDERQTELAEALKCSEATIHNERKVIEKVIGRHIADESERVELLKITRDLLFLKSEPWT